MKNNKYSIINPFFSLFSKHSNFSLIQIRNALFFYNLINSSKLTPTQFVHSLSFPFLFPSSKISSFINIYCNIIHQIFDESIFSYYSKPNRKKSQKQNVYHLFSYDIFLLKNRKSKSFKTSILKLKETYKKITNKKVSKKIK